MLQQLCKGALILCLFVAIQMLSWRAASGSAIVILPPEPTAAGDLAPRGAPDGVVNVADLAVLQQILLGRIQPTDAEVHSADVAPREAPDGVLNAADMIVLQQFVLRKSAPSDPTQPPVPPVLEPLPLLTNIATQAVTGSGPPNLPIRLYLNDSLLGSNVAAADGRFSFAAGLREGDNLVYATAYDNGQESDRSNVLHITLDNIPPAIVLTGLVDGVVTSTPDQSIAGTLSERGQLAINGNPVPVDANLAFSYPISLSGDGQHEFLLVAEDVAGNVTTQQMAVSLDTAPPASVDATAVTVTEQDGSHYVLTAPAGAAEAGATVEALNARTGTTAKAIVDPDGHFSVGIVGQGGDSLYLFQLDAAGNKSAWAYSKLPGTPPSATVQFTAPLQGAAIGADRILVEGAVTGPENLGVTVNGHVATVMGGHFFVNNLPLHAGQNVVTAKASIPNGDVSSTSIVITSTATTPVYFNAEPCSGIPELTTRLRLITTLTRSIVKIDVDTDSDGVPDFSTSDTTKPVSITFAQKGLYAVTATATDSAGVMYSTPLKVAVFESLALDAQLRSVFQSFLNDLKAGNIAAAMSRLNGPMKTKYQAMFETAAGELPSLIDNLGELRGGAVAGNLAQYVVVREEQGMQRGYPIFLIRDQDGVWRIGGM